MMAEQGTYVYAISRDLDPAVLHQVSGVGDTSVRTVESGGLTAVVSTVDLDEFGEQALRQNLENLAWLEQTARSHHAVAETARESAAVTPLRLATVYYSDERVREMLVDQHDAFARALDRITGRVEWGVKAYTQLPDRHASSSKEPAEESRDSSSTVDAESSTGGAGAAYLRRRREQQQTWEQASRQAFNQADQVHTELRNFSVASRLHRAQDAGLSGRSELMVLNGAYLVDRGLDQQFLDLVREVAGAQQGLEVEVTGPWAPYSFATVTEAESEEQAEHGRTEQ